MRLRYASTDAHSGIFFGAPTLKCTDYDGSRFPTTHEIKRCDTQGWRPAHILVF